MADALHSDATTPASAPPTVELGPGTKIGRYAILERVGAGGMGVVYSAYDPELDRRVAIKLLAPDVIGEESRLRLLREARAMARLSHPNVVPVYDAGTVDGRVFVAMEFVQGVTLREWLEDETRAWTEVLETMRRAALGLHTAHEAGLVHRDFKPDNVMVGDDGRVRVLDFGLARSASPDGLVEARHVTTGSDVSATGVGTSQKSLSVPITSDGAMLGTPAYMPPEQLEGRTVDARTDQWSFCVTLYEALYGARPFAGDTVAAFVLSMHNDGIEPPPDTSPVPQSVFAAIARGLELEPDARHPTIAALLDALELPTRSRRPLVPIAAVGLAAVVGGGWWWSAEREDDACEARMLAASEIWSADARRAGADAFERSAARYGAEAWERASGRVSEYVAAWSQEAERACRSAGPGTAEIDALRSRCLDARLRTLTSLVETFSNANDEVVRGAVAAAFQLPELEACADVPGLLATVRPPEDPALQAELERLAVALEDAASFELSGDYAEGRRRALAVVERARELAYDPFTAQALRTQASFAVRQGEYEAARALYVEAFERAATARDDAGAAEASAQLLVVIGSDLQIPAAADTWTTVGATMLERAGLSEQAPEAGFHNAVGNVAFSQGDYERALVEFSTARDLWEALPGDYPIDMGFVLSNIGAVLTTLGRYDEAREQHLRALQIREETFGPRHPDVAMSLGNLGILAYSTGDMAAARDYQERALAIKRAVLPPRHLSLAATAINLGLILERVGDVEGAVEFFEEAVEIRTASLGPEHADVGIAMGNLADAYRHQGGRNEEAEALQRGALEIQRKALGGEHAAVAGSLQNLSVLMLEMGRPDEAKPLIEEALEIFTKAFGPDHAAVAMCWHTLSQTHEAKGQLAEAIAAQEEEAAALKRSGADAFALARAHVRLGQLRWLHGADRAAARGLVEDARAVMAKTPDQQPGRQDEVEAWLQSHPLPK